MLAVRSVLALLSLLLLPVACVADAFSEFRIPDHSWRTGAGGFSAWASRHRASAARFLDTSRDAIGQVHARLALGHDSDSLSRSFLAVIAGSLDGSHRQSSYVPGVQWDDERTSSGAQICELSGTQRSNVRGSVWVVGGGASFRAEFSQNRDREDNRSDSYYRTLRRDLSRYDRYDYLGTAELMLGRGRVRDATVVMDVHVLEERLLEAGAIAAPLSPATRARLAKVLLAGGAIDAAHERPDRFYWREVERVLREEGALGANGLDAYSVMRAREGYAPGSVSRMRGAYGGLLLEAEHAHVVEHRQFEYEWRRLLGDSLVSNYGEESGSRSSIGADNVFVGVQGEAHLPVGWRWQFDASGSAAVTVSSQDRGLNTATQLSAYWIVADRWRAGILFASSRHYLYHDNAPPPYPRDGWETQAAGFASYFIEDHLTLDAQLGSTQQSRDSVPYRYYYLDHRFTLGLTYRFLGRFDAPGLMEPMRPLP